MNAEQRRGGAIVLVVAFAGRAPTSSGATGGLSVARGLAARAPYFANGSARDLRELVDYYDRRFDMRLSGQEKQDLINFLGVL